MTKIRAYTALQERFGKEQAEILAEFVESQDGPDLSRLASKDDLHLIRQDLKDEIQHLRQDMKDLELRLTKELSKNREDMISRMNWNTLIQIVAIIGGLAALAKIV